MCSQPAQPSPPESPSSGEPSPAPGLPQPLTSFVGRTAQRAAIVTLVRQPGVRLLTLAGPAGVGKTRLAVAAATDVAADFADGVHFVSFAALHESEHVPLAIAEALGVHALAGEAIEARVIGFARERTMLLVLDNLEHLVPVPFITRLLTACPHLTVIATSRVVLHLSGEFEYVVPPMDVPDPASAPSPEVLAGIESVALLVNRARQVNPDFDLTADNAADIAAICARLDGLPLAIELAAARMKIFAPEALLDRLSDRLSLLTGGPSDRPAHQRTIRDTIGWSHDLLSPDEQRFFRRLAVFEAGITPEAAAWVCGEADAPLSEYDALDQLTSLVDKSLVQQGRQSPDGPRFVLLETVRHYALERLRREGEHGAIRERHAAFCLDLVTRLVPTLMGPNQAAATARLEAEQANLRAALEAFQEFDDPEAYTRLATALWRFWRLRGMLTEGRFWLEPTVDPAWQARLPDPLRSTAFFTTGWLALEQGDTDHAGRYGEAALAIATRIGDDGGMARAYSLLSFVDSRLGDNARAIARMEASLAHHRAAQDRDSIAGALNNLAILALDSGEYERVVTYCAESRQAFTALGNLHGASHSIDTMGVALYCLGRFEEAMRCSRESLAIDRQLPDTRGIAISLDHVGKCARALGDLDAAWEAHAESLRYRKDVGDPRGLVVWLEAMALWLVHAGCAEAAAKIFGAIEVTRTASNMPLLSHEVGDHEATERLARARLGEAHYETVLARGRWLTLDDAVTVAHDAAEARTTERARGTPAAADGIAERYGLTPREHEVLLLIAQRYADKEIADALFISPRTVARHVTGIFSKMGVHSRRQAAALVEGNGHLG